MPLTLGDAPKSSTSTPAPAGNHPARCYAVVDLGTHTDEGQYGVKVQRKIRLSWELPDELHVFRDENGPEPFAVHQTYTFSTHEKATMRKNLEAWRGRAFTDHELKSFELKSLIGVPCLLNVVHVTKGEKTYANVKGISPVPKGLTVTPAINKPTYFEISMGPDSAAYASLPQFLREIIAKCHEWTGKVGEEPNTTAGGERPATADDPDIDWGIDDGRAPF